jgi:arylsulfatase A-like enzyme
MIFRYFVWISFLALFSGACVQEKDQTDRPNIVLIMADDLGYGGIGCYGNSHIETPNLDKLAQEGLRFTDFHSNGAVCSPTRAALLTGRYQQRSGMEGVIYVRGATREIGMDTAVTTIADLLKDHGYRTGIMGKWHLGYDESYNPVQNGFDEFIGYRSGNIDYHTHYDNAGIFDWYHNLDTVREAGYVTDLISDHSVEFIKKNKDNPFFLYIAHEAPHVPFQGRNDPGYRVPDQEFSYFGPVEDRHRAYKDMVEAMDEGIGRVVEAIRQTGLQEKTLIFFFSDNGGLQGYGDNGVLRGAKTTLWEGGHRVPAIASWYGKIDKGISDELIMTFDLFPTILAICQAVKPRDLILDGIDISPVLFHGKSLEPREVFWRYREQCSVRKDKMKLLIADNDTLLFDLSNDIEESHDIAFDSIELLQVMLRSLKEWEGEMDSYDQKTE